MVHIDGRYGEGGGQIIRTALSLSAMTGRAVEIDNIRAGRAKPGLQPQHLAAVRAAAELCEAEVSGSYVHSMQLLFRPRVAPCPRSYALDIGTAGAGTLVLQTVLLPLALASEPSEVHITGGTHVPHAPTMEYVESTYLPILRRAGISVQCGYARAGFFPRGGGEIHSEIAAGSTVSPLILVERGKLLTLKATILTSELPEHVGDRGAATVVHALRGIGQRIEVEQRRRPSAGPGAAVVISAACENGIGGFSALGERGKPMERVAEEACTAFLRWWEAKAACDEHLGDQLVLPMALAAGESRWSVPAITEHLRTAIWTVQQFLPVSADISEEGNGSPIVVLCGVGMPPYRS